MATTRSKKPARQVKSLRARKLTGKEAKAVKGGGSSTYLNATQKVREALADGSVRVADTALKQ
jgi:hypothetical protein